MVDVGNKLMSGLQHMIFLLEQIELRLFYQLHTRFWEILRVHERQQGLRRERARLNATLHLSLYMKEIKLYPNQASMKAEEKLGSMQNIVENGCEKLIAF